MKRTIVLSALVAAITSAGAAFADPPHGQGNGQGHGQGKGHGANKDVKEQEKDVRDARKELAEKKKELREAGPDAGAAKEAVKEAKEKLEKELKELRESRKDRRKKTVDALRDKLGDLTKKPQVRAEMRIHAKRVAHLKAAKRTAVAAGKTDLADKADKLLQKENERHDKRMQQLREEGEKK